MDKYYIAFINKTRDGKLKNAILADFDADNLSNRSTYQLSLCVNDNDCGGIMDDVQLDHAYIVIDFNDSPPYIAVDKEYDQGINWVLVTNEIYDNFESAKKAFLEKANYSGDYRKAALKVLLS